MATYSLRGRCINISYTYKIYLYTYKWVNMRFIHLLLRSDWSKFTTMVQLSLYMHRGRATHSIQYTTAHILIDCIDNMHVYSPCTAIYGRANTQNVRSFLDLVSHSTSQLIIIFALCVYMMITSNSNSPTFLLTLILGNLLN